MKRQVAILSWVEAGEIIDAIGISPATLHRDWKAARAWLLSHAPSEKDRGTFLFSEASAFARCRRR